MEKGLESGLGRELQGVMERGAEVGWREAELKSGIKARGRECWRKSCRKGLMVAYREGCMHGWMEGYRDA